MKSATNLSFQKGLEAKIRQIILNQGPIPFEHFMRLCLYDEEHGFYRKRQVLGKKGHFFTNIQVSHLYGQLIAQQLMEMWEVMGRPSSFTLVEQGAHDGQVGGDGVNNADDIALRCIGGNVQGIQVGIRIECQRHSLIEALGTHSALELIAAVLVSRLRR